MISDQEVKLALSCILIGVVIGSLMSIEILARKNSDKDK